MTNVLTKYVYIGGITHIGLMILVSKMKEYGLSDCPKDDSMDRSLDGWMDRQACEQGRGIAPYSNFFL